jgi:hypothetical protein
LRGKAPWRRGQNRYRGGFDKGNQILPANRLMFIEPRIVIATGGGQVVVLPNIVICNSRQVIGVIELKYAPRARPRYNKDIAALAALAVRPASATRRFPAA